MSLFNRKNDKNQKTCAYIDIRPVKICTYFLNTNKKIAISLFNWKNDKNMCIY